MTVNSTYTAPQYTGNGATTAFSFPYAFFATSDLVVVLFDTTANANVTPQPVLGGAATYDYAVTGTQDVNLGEYPNGTLTFNTAPLSNHRITIQRNVPATQPIALSNTSPFPAKTIEGEMDRLTLLVQQMAAAVARALVLNPSDITSNFVMPAAGLRANQVFLFDSSGNPTVGALPSGTAPISAPMQPVVAASSLLAAADLLLANGFAAGADAGFPSLFGGNAGQRNRLRNSRMKMDQRNGGTLQSAPVSGVYLLDGWVYGAAQTGKFDAQQNKNAVTPPPGFSYYLGLSVANAYTVVTTDSFVVFQRIEGSLIADLAFGTASAKPVTVLAKVYSSLTGTFSGVLRNEAATRSYPFTYSIPVANTWTSICINIPGDTGGSWPVSNASAAQIVFSLGVGPTYKGPAGAWAATNYAAAIGEISVVATAAATFYVTGVELRDGTWPANSAPEVSAGFADDILNYRYFYRTTAAISLQGNAANAGDAVFQSIFFPTQMRSAPTVVPSWASANNAMGQSVIQQGTFSAQAYVQATSGGAFAISLAVGTSFTAEL